jgi:signal transduction histidine kinase
MNLQARLTLGSVLLAILIAGTVSTVDLGNRIQFEYQTTLDRAELVRGFARDAVLEALQRQPYVALPAALREPELARKLRKLSTSSKAILAIDLVSAQNHEVLASTLESRIGKPAAPPDFSPLVNKRQWKQQVSVLLSDAPSYYMLEEALGADNIAIIYVRVILYPGLIRESLRGALLQNLRISLFSVAAAAALTFVFSLFGFRKLGRIGRMLDLVTSGKYEPDSGAPVKPATDELSVMASKVNLLGQRLRGAEFEVSDLRGNIDHLLHDLEDTVLIFNREFRLIFATGTVEKFLGQTPGDLVGRSLGDVFPPSTLAGLLVEQAAETGRDIRNRRVRMAGPEMVLLSVDLLAASGVLVRLRDPEAQHKINRELRTADRLSALSRVSAGVAHEVKNPLNAMMLHIEVARAKLSQGDTDVTEQMDIIAREVLRLDRVVRTFLDFTRPVELKLVNLPVQELVREIVELAGPQAVAAHITMAVREDADGVEVRVDRDLFKQAVLNIVVNGMQAMPEGGEMRIESSASGDWAELRISDTGGGVAPELREKIFRLYFTTKPKGSGIGLAMTFRIVQLHDGTIDFTSEPGKGTTFLIRLPIAV